MDLIKIHTGDYATNVGQVAAAQIASLLFALDGDGPLDPIQNWFAAAPGDPGNYAGLSIDAELEAAVIVEQLGQYVCKHQVEQGERLFRHASGARLIAGRDWGSLPIEQRLPWETFTSTCRQAFNALAAAQLAIVDVRKAAGVAPQPGLKREDSIFEEVEDMFALRPEAVEGLRLSGIYDRGQIAERQRLAFAAEDALREEAEAFNAQWDKFGGDPAKFDHDGDGKPGGSRKRKPPAPLSAGEPPVRPPVNRGGRGNRKTG